MANRAQAVDMVTLARLHAALDSVVETQQLIAAIRDASAVSGLAVTRVAELIGETRELLRGMLARPDSRQLSTT